MSLPWLGFPGWTLLVAILPLLFLENYFFTHKDRFPPIAFWGHVFFAALIWNLLASWWMMQASAFGVASAMVFNSLLISFVWYFAHNIRRKFSSSLGYISLVVFYISYEFLQFNWDMEWPCLQLGSVLVMNPKIVQWYEFTGAFGGSLWVLLVNVFLFQCIQAYRQKTKTIVRNYISTALFLIVTLPLTVSYVQYWLYNEEENPVHIAIVQPHVDPYLEKFDMESEEEKLQHFLRLAKTVIENKTDILLGPETIFENPWYWNEDKLDSNKFLNRMLSFINDYRSAELLFGVSSFKIYHNEKEATYTARNRGGMFFDRYSTALFANREGEIQLQHKSKLVMGVEKTPLIKYFPFLKNVFIDLGGTTGTLGYDVEPQNIKTRQGLYISPVICFESVFGEYVAKKVRSGSHFIVVISNDGWWKGSRGYKQHLLFSQLRAIETRRSIARAANTGTSCLINQKGEVLLATPWWEEAAISGVLNANDKQTFYTKHGDFVARSAVFASIFLALMVFVRRFK